MDRIEEVPNGGWPQFMFDGEKIVGQVGDFGPWYEVPVGKAVRFNRHGSFKVTTKLVTKARLEVTLPRKGWNSKRGTHTIDLPIRKVVTVQRRCYNIRKLNPFDEARFGKPIKGAKITVAR